MTLSEILQDIHACEEDMLMYERKYNILTETFYAAYSAGEEPRITLRCLNGATGPARIRSGYDDTGSIRRLSRRWKNKHR
jgi:hypothetical protein